MLPKSYLVFKWTIYSLATLLLFALQYLVLNHVHVFGITPFLYPMLPAVLSSYEGLRRGSVFSPGFLCGLAVSAMGLVLTGLLRIAVMLLSGGRYPALMLQILAGETLLSLPALVVILPLYRVIHRRCARDY